MPISGLVLTFDDRVVNCDDALAALRKNSAIEVGVADGNKLAIVVDSTSKEHDQEIWNRLHELPRVVSVGVAFVALEDDFQNPGDEAKD